MNRFLPALALAVVFWCGSGLETRSQSYSFTTIAGLAGSSGAADGTNSDARFNFPTGIAVDNDGSLYVADYFNHAIRKITPIGANWVVTTPFGQMPIAGSADGTNNSAQFNRPNGVAVNSQGDLFVADFNNHTIRGIQRYGTNWAVTTLAGLPGPSGTNDGLGSSARFYSPTAVAVDNSNHLYVADLAGFTIRGLVQQGTNWAVSTLAGTPLDPWFSDGTNSDGEFDYPRAVAVNSGGTLFVADWGNNAVRQVLPVGSDWVTTTIAGGDSFLGTSGTNDGPGLSALFNGPMGIAQDGAGNLYVTDQSNHTIRKLTPVGSDWTVSTIGGLPGAFGTNDGAGAIARFNKPWGITVDSGGNLFVADWKNHTIRMGVPQVPPRPSLQIVCVGNQVVVSWPLTATNFTLQNSPSIGVSAAWTTLSNGITTSGTNFIRTNSIGPAAGYYRLMLN